MNYIFIAGTTCCLPKALCCDMKTNAWNKLFSPKPCLTSCLKPRTSKGPHRVSFDYLLSAVFRNEPPCPLALSPWNGGWTTSQSCLKPPRPDPSPSLETGTHVSEHQRRDISSLPPSSPSFLWERLGSIFYPDNRNLCRLWASCVCPIIFMTVPGERVSDGTLMSRDICRKERHTRAPQQLGDHSLNLFLFLFLLKLRNELRIYFFLLSVWEG